MFTMSPTGNLDTLSHGCSHMLQLAMMENRSDFHKRLTNAHQLKVAQKYIQYNAKKLIHSRVQVDIQLRLKISISWSNTF